LSFGLCLLSFELLFSGAVHAATPIPTGTWVMVPTNGFPVNAVGWESLVYSPAVKKSVFWGGYHTLGSEPNEALVGYDFNANRWDVLSLGGDFHTEATPEAGHPWGTFVYDPNQNLFLDNAINSGSNAAEMTLHAWWFDPVGLTARDKETTPRPGQITTAAAVFDASHNVYVLVTGADTWTYSESTNMFQTITTNGTPPAGLSYAAMAYNSANQKSYLFGGAVGSSYSNNLYTYDVPTHTWTRLAPSGALPPARQYANFAYDSTHNIFLLFGGETRAAHSAILGSTTLPPTIGRH